MQTCGNTMSDLSDQDSTSAFLRSACPWTSEIILLASGNSLLKSMNCVKMKFISKASGVFSAIFHLSPSFSPKFTSW